MRVLVVDDSVLFRTALVAWLADLGSFQVVGVASDGLEALHLARSEQPDLILMDLNMPVCGGLKATRLIRAEMPQVRILVLTASLTEELREMALFCGAEDCVDKDVKQIRAALQRLVGNPAMMVA